jgi:hypothetical protein
MTFEDPVEAARAELARAVADAEAVVAGESAGTDLVPTRSNDPVMAKRQLAAVQTELRKKQAIVREAAARLEKTIKAEMEKAQQVLAPMQAAVERLEAGIFSVNLYLGRDEDILLLRDGDSAPAEEPITLRQLVLYMDEEIASIAAEGGFSPVNDIVTFDEWLLADEAHLDLVLPERKGIVALRPRRKPPRRDGWRDSEDAKANRRTYWLVRNGERVYRTVTALELEDRVLPYRREMESLFLRKRRGGVMEPMEPGSHEWETAQDRAEERELRYLRVGLVLEGLLHRTPIFHPLPDAGVSFLDPRCLDDGRVRYITDAEGLLGTGEESFEDWRRRLAEELQPGMRIVLGPGLSEYRHDHRRGNSRLQPEVANLPAAGRVYTVERRGRSTDRYTEKAGTDFVFRYREGERWVGDGAWGGGELREPKRRAAATVYAHDHFVLPFDLATVEEMERFLRSRTDRHHYEEMFPTLKAAIAAKRREQEVEEPFLTMLAGVLARENGVSVEEAQRAVPDLVTWWKTKRKMHRPLLLQAQREDVEAGETPTVGIAEAVRAPRLAAAAVARGQGERARAREEEAEQVERSRQAVADIVAEHARRVRDERRPVNFGLVELLRGRHADGLLCIARPRGRGYVVVQAAEPEKNVYVHVHEYDSRGVLKDEQQWTLPRRQSVRAWHVIEQAERWSAWDFNASEAHHLRGPEREELKALALAKLEQPGAWLAVGVKRGGEEVAWWRMDGFADIDEKRLLTGECRGPKIAELTARWHRREDGAVELRRRRETEAQRLGEFERTLPWEKRVWRSAFDDEEQGPAPMEWTVLHTDPVALRVLARELKRYRDAQARRAEMSKRVGLLVGSVEAEWLRRRWTAERARFDDDFGDPALWPAHRQSMERHIFMPPEWQSALRAAAGSLHSSGVTLWECVAHFVEVGEDPAGCTVGEVADAASERWGELWAAEDSWERADRKRAVMPAEMREYVLSEYRFAHVEDPQPAEPVLDDEDLGLVDGILADVRAAVAGDEREEPVFDVEGEAEEEALPRGT